MLLRNLHRRIRLRATQVAKVIESLDSSRAFTVPAGELSIAILDGPAMARLHADFLGDLTETDVITFEGDRAADTAGEICVCADVAQEYAARHGIDFAEELCLCLVHGYLHLAGFDDVDPARRRLMRAAERRAMGFVHAANAIPEPRIL
ncbi:MAG TPA: rRNA maturation RNase YbeY [Opitutaceae bacterium]